MKSLEHGLTVIEDCFTSFECDGIISHSENTGLPEAKTYYLGHLLGETTGPDGGTFTVSFADITPIRSAVGQAVDAGNHTDIDKSGTVSFADISSMRPNVGGQLRQIIIQ